MTKKPFFYKSTFFLTFSYILMTKWSLFFYVCTPFSTYFDSWGLLRIILSLWSWSNSLKWCYILTERSFDRSYSLTFISYYKSNSYSYYSFVKVFFVFFFLNWNFSYKNSVLERVRSFLSIFVVLFILNSSSFTPFC